MKKILSLMFLFLFVVIAIVTGQPTDPPDPGVVADPLWMNILNIALVALLVIGGGYLAIAKKKLAQALLLLQLVVDALEDNKISSQEVKAIIAQAKKIISK